MDVKFLFEALDASGLAAFSKASGGVFALVQTVHLASMALLGGMLLVTDLRLLNVVLRGVSADLVVEATRKWINYALAAMILSGIYMSSAVAIKLYFNFFFWSKMTALILSCISLYFIKLPLLERGVDRLGVWTVRLIALASLVTWFSVAASGRWIGFSG